MSCGLFKHVSRYLPSVKGRSFSLGLAVVLGIGLTVGAWGQNYPIVTIFPQSGSAVGELRLRELIGNGTNYVYHKSADSLASSGGYTWPLPGTGCLASDSGGVITVGSCGASNWQDTANVLTPLNSGRIVRIPAVDTLDEFYIGGTAVGGANDSYVRANISTEGKPGGFMRIGQSSTRYLVFGWFNDEGTPANAFGYITSGSNRLVLQDGTGNFLIGSGAANTHKLSLAGTQLVTGNATFSSNVLFSTNETSVVGATSSRGDIAYFRRFDAHDGARSRVAINSPGAGSDAGSAISVVNNAGTVVAFISYAGSLSVTNSLSAVNGININGNAFTDSSRNTTINNLSLLGTCTGGGCGASLSGTNTWTGANTFSNQVTFNNQVAVSYPNDTILDGALQLGGNLDAGTTRWRIDRETFGTTSRFYIKDEDGGTRFQITHQAFGLTINLTSVNGDFQANGNVSTFSDGVGNLGVTGFRFAEVSVVNGVRVAGNLGITRTITVKGSDGANCDNIIQGGVITATSCP